MIKKLGLAEVQVFDQNTMGEVEIQDMLQWSDVIIQQSPLGIETVASIAKFKDMGKAVVGDYDDLTFSLSPFNPAYKTLGLRDVTIKRTDTGKEELLWKDGVDGFALKPNYFRYRSLQDILKSLSAVTTTCGFIKGKYGEFSDNIHILPNSIDFNLFKPLMKKDTGQIRIGWTASDSHHAEIWMVKRIMRKVMDKYGDKVKFVLLGNIEGICEGDISLDESEIERHNFCGLDIYPLKAAALNLDIGICPLNVEDPNSLDFNRAKSQLKWSEYASLKIPAVCSKIEPYDCVEDGKTGLLASNDDEFVDKIGELVESEYMRDRIATAAFEKNYEDYNLEKNVVLWMEVYEQALETMNA